MHKLLKRAGRFVKRALGNVLRCAPLSSRYLGPPKAEFANSSAWVAIARKGGAKAQFIELFAGGETRRREPESLSGEPHPKFALASAEIEPQSFVVRLRSARIWGRNGSVITEDDVLLRDISRAGSNDSVTHPVHLRLWLGKVRKVRATIAVIATAWPQVYFHWMFDVLPRIELLRLAGLREDIRFFVVPPITRPFQEETLLRLSIGRADRIEAHDPWRFHLQTEDLLVPSLPSLLDRPRRWACDFLRREFGTVAPSTNRRIYISRKGACGRNIINEPEVLKLLRSAGFETLTMDGRTVSEQAAIFAAAGVVVAPHGAALTNLVFCQPRTAVIDIFSPQYVNPCYWVLAEELELRYFYLIGEGEASLKSAELGDQSANIIVNIEQLRTLLDRAFS